MRSKLVRAQEILVELICKGVMLDFYVYQRFETHLVGHSFEFVRSIVTGLIIW